MLTTGTYHWHQTNKQEKRCLCRVSNLNLLAFIANKNIASADSEYSFNNVYIIDLNLPNEPHLIKNHYCRVKLLTTRVAVYANVFKIKTWFLKNLIKSDLQEIKSKPFLFHCQQSLS